MTKWEMYFQKPERNFKDLEEIQKTCKVYQEI